MQDSIRFITAFASRISVVCHTYWEQLQWCQLISQSIKTNLYSAMRRKRIRGAVSICKWWWIDWSTIICFAAHSGWYTCIWQVCKQHCDWHGQLLLSYHPTACYLMVDSMWCRFVFHLLSCLPAGQLGLHRYCVCWKLTSWVISTLLSFISVLSLLDEKQTSVLVVSAVSAFLVQ